MTEGSQPASAPPEPTPQERCHVCGVPLPKDAAFCPNCGAVKASLVGKPLPYASPRIWAEQMSRPKIPFRVTAKSIAAVTLLSIFFMSLLLLFTLIYGVSITGPAILDRTGNLADYGVFLVLPIFVTLFILSGPALFAYYIFLIFAIVASAAWVYATSARTFTKEILGKAKSREHSAMFDTFALLCATLFFTYAIVVLVILFGGDVGTGVSTGTTADALFLLANAAVWEELAVRVLLIGVPLLLINAAMNKMRKGAHHYILGGGFKFGILETLLVVVSSIIFGVAHWVGGWPAWKIPDAAVAGLAFGYLFLRHGLPSAILLHFVNDYLTLPTDLFSTPTGALGIVTIMLVLFWALIGSVFFAYYVLRATEFLTKRTYFEPKPLAIGIPGVDPRVYGYQQPYYVPAQQPPGPHVAQSGVVTPGPQVGHGYGGGYICPVCGYNQARWADGRFHCLRCGNVS